MHKSVLTLREEVVEYREWRERAYVGMQVRLQGRSDRQRGEESQVRFTHLITASHNTKTLTNTHSLHKLKVVLPEPALKQ